MTWGFPQSTTKARTMPDYPEFYVGQKGSKIKTNQTDFVGKGGEKSAWLVGGDVVAGVWHNPAEMPPIQKLRDLQKITHPDIIKPLDLVFSDKARRQVIGHTMRFVEDAWPLVMFFAKPFRKRNKIGRKEQIKVIKLLQQMHYEVHKVDGCLVVDSNDMNWLVGHNLNNVYGIDTPSYQTKSYPATAINWSIRDPHCNGMWTQETDMYSFAILAFMVLIGHHPFEARHPDFEHIPKKDKQRRNAMMESNVSAFHDKSTLPRACEPLDSIPTALRHWMMAVFEKGLRTLPPSDYEAVVKLVAQVIEISGSDNFDIKELAVFGKEISGYFVKQNASVTCISDQARVNGKLVPLPNSQAKIAFTEKLTPIAVWSEGNDVRLHNLSDDTQISFDTQAKNVMVYDGHIFLHNGSNVTKVRLTELPTGGIIPSLEQSIQVLDLPNATFVGDGVIVQNMIGRQNITIFPDGKPHPQIPIPEFDDYQIIDAKFEKGLLVLIGVKSGQTDRLVIRFSNDFSNYDSRKVEDVPYAGINFTVNDNSTAVLMNEEENVEVIVVLPGGDTKIIEDDKMSHDMRLYSKGSKILFTQGDKMCQMTMK